MGSVGLGEILVIVLVVLLVFGPNKLPEIMRNLGKAYRVFQDETQKAKDTLRESFEEHATQTPPGPGIIDTPDEQPAPTSQPDQTPPEQTHPDRTHEDT
ncbi:MAG TPA: twin-arginine translocase TatA/TatE family subunit [Actinomycetota bacterium]|nr:twin-arginine translocase TatA/TatE family subunit [Actinomycetota bacterium]